MAPTLDPPGTTQVEPYSVHSLGADQGDWVTVTYSLWSTDFHINYSMCSIYAILLSSSDDLLYRPTLQLCTAFDAAVVLDTELVVVSTALTRWLVEHSLVLYRGQHSILYIDNVVLIRLATVSNGHSFVMLVKGAHWVGSWYCFTCWVLFVCW